MQTTTQTVADRMLCHCLQVKQSTVADSVAIYGAESVKDVIRTCGAGGGCNSCHAKIKQMIASRGTLDANVNAADCPF